MKFWINTVSKDHVLKGIEEGFTQADHGKNTRLKYLDKGDYIVFYSPRTKYEKGEPLQSFTGIGQIADDEPYQVEMKEGFFPWRRNLKFFKHNEVKIHNLIERLTFIKDKKYWGYPFRRGLFEISRADFLCISESMNVDIEKA